MMPGPPGQHGAHQQLTVRSLAAKWFQAPPARIRSALMSGFVSVGLLCSAALPGSAAAENDAPEQSTVTASPIEDGGYFEIAITSVGYQPLKQPLDPNDKGDFLLRIYPSFNGAWRKGRFFFEAQRGEANGLSLGATLWHDDRTVLDLLAVNIPGVLSDSYDLEDVPPRPEAEREKDLLGRDEAFAASGLRLRHYRGPNLLQLAAVVDWEHGNGVLASAHAGRQWQFGNWSAQATVGLRYASETLADFVLGVDADEATTRFPVYGAPGTWYVEADVNVSRPLTRHLVFRAGLGALQFDSSITDSPLVAERGIFFVDTGISYVF